MKRIVFKHSVLLLVTILICSFTEECTKVKIKTDDFRKATSVHEIFSFPDSSSVFSFDLTVKITERIKTFSSKSNKFTPEMMNFKEVNSFKTRKYYIENIRVRDKKGVISKFNALCIEFE